MTKFPVNGILVKINAKSTINKNENFSDFARYYNSKRKIKYLSVVFLYMCCLYANSFLGIYVQVVLTE